jgi:serine/threonine-protein kinase
VGLAEAELRALEGALSPGYQLGDLVATGGMATVYRAMPSLGGRHVAVKVMHPHLAATIAIERFHQEVEIIRATVHPRIVPLLETGQAGQLLYYLMPYVDGETLQARLDRTRRVPAEEAVRITLDLLEGLACAHARGVLHRDIKPENILLDGEHALLTDFGLARAIGEANYRRLTETGIIVGTVFYMSPEQLREDRSLDQRSDLYSVGCVLYEMLTGEPPYAARSLTEVIGRILKAEVPSVTRLAPSVPPALDEVVRRALAKDAAGRYESAEAFAAALLEVGEG